ncbi:ArsR family transcriptional regulator, partial [Escherichia coli]|nr:ArsR family transcriptional regulator [Escherichia coli]
VGVTVANASHHLRTLHKQGVVKFRKEGKLAFYSLEDEHIKQIMMFALAHKQEGQVNV